MKDFDKGVIIGMFIGILSFLFGWGICWLFCTIMEVL